MRWPKIYPDGPNIGEISKERPQPRVLFFSRQQWKTGLKIGGRESLLAEVGEHDGQRRAGGAIHAYLAGGADLNRIVAVFAAIEDDR